MTVIFLAIGRVPSWNGRAEVPTRSRRIRFLSPRTEGARSQGGYTITCHAVTCVVDWSWGGPSHWLSQTRAHLALTRPSADMPPSPPPPNSYSTHFTISIHIVEYPYSSLLIASSPLYENECAPVECQCCFVCLYDPVSGCEITVISELALIEHCYITGPCYLAK